MSYLASVPIYYCKVCKQYEFTESLDTHKHVCLGPHTEPRWEPIPNDYGTPAIQSFRIHIPQPIKEEME